MFCRVHMVLPQHWHRSQVGTAVVTDLQLGGRGRTQIFCELYHTHKVTEQRLLSTLHTIRHTNLSNVLRAHQPNVRH